MVECRPPMVTITQSKILIRLRAGIALLILMGGLLFATVALAFTPSDSCSMSCCVSEGHCCCNPPKPSVEGQSPDATDQWVEASFTNGCPRACISSQHSSKLRHFDECNDAVSNPNISESPVKVVEQEISRNYPAKSQPSSPRAPPLLFILAI